MPIRIRRPDDFHVHLRQGEMLRAVIGHTAKHFARALVMPNTDPPIVTAEDVEGYRNTTLAAWAECPTTANVLEFEPLMTIKLTRGTTPEIVHAARQAGTIAIKFYPEGATTNASGGYASLREVPRDVLEAVAASQMVLCVHAEDPTAFVLAREIRCLEQVDWIVQQYPRLRIVIEHLTSKDGVEWVKSYPNDRRIGATITAHHLWSTLDDVVGGMLNPHAFCKPIPKAPDDRDALIEAAIEDDRFFFGSDSAPHRREKKECASGCAGAFTAPVALSLLAEIFEARGGHDWVIKLERFVSERGADFYGWTNAGVKRNEGMITLEPTGFTVPDEIAGVVPFLAGRRMRWAVTANEPNRKTSP